EEPAEISVCLGPSRGKHDAGQPARMLDRQNLGDRASRGVTDHMGTLDPQRIEQTDNIGRHSVDRIPDPRLIALSDTPVVEGYNFVALGECRDLILPNRCKSTQSGNEQDWEAHAVPLVIERAVAD